MTEAIVIGGSAGSLDVIIKTLPLLKKNLSLAVILILHRKSSYDSSLAQLLGNKSALPVKEAEEKDLILAGNIYIAPADYHLLVESDRTLSLDYSEKIHYSRPAIDATFQTAAEVYGSKLAGIILSGANSDGTEGLMAIQNAGGITAVQNPVTAEVAYMPKQALTRVKTDLILEKENIAAFINSL